MKICLLDVGTKIYGDCLLVTHGDQRLLIDGAHKGDDDLILSQLTEQFGQNKPFHFDLLVVTHCHADHIGCLPELVANGDITAGWALVADELLGFGQTGAEPGGDAVPLYQAALSVALQEENYAGLSDAAVSEFLQDVAKLPDRYSDMLTNLDQNGTRVVRYNKDAAAMIREIESQFSGIGLHVLGPTPKQLEICANAIAANSRSTSDLVSAVAPDMVRRDAAPSLSDLVSAYRRMLRPSASDDLTGDTFQRRGMGAKNDQSIVLKVEADGWSALLTGDMQFADPQVDGLEDLVGDLLSVVDSAGPYDFIKTAHHTSNNGINDDVFGKWSHTTLFAHSGGSRDANHPNPAALDVLQSHRADLTFARTDHNGLVAIEKSDGQVTISKERGRFNDFQPNPKRSSGDDEIAEGASVGVGPRTPFTMVSSGKGGAGDFVEVTAKVPHVKTCVTLTVEVKPDDTAVAASTHNQAIRNPPINPQSSRIRQGETGNPKTADIIVAVAPGRTLPRLLVVTHQKRLSDNIGQAESTAVLAALQKANATVVQIPSEANVATDAVVPVLAELRRGGYRGVIILGGYDVVPPLQLDVLDAQTRSRLEAIPASQRIPDPFIVWSDDLYGDTDADLLPDIPVTRIPDGRRADAVIAALGATSTANSTKFGIRNTRRPFADTVYPNVPGNSNPLAISEPFSSSAATASMGLGNAYYMLHGADWNGACYWGETATSSMCEAWNTTNVPKSARGAIIFTGCCFAGLTAGPAADQFLPSTPFRPRGPEASIAIAYLQAGALAFIGCTGSHYSPVTPPYTYYGQPMHVSFWNKIRKGTPPPEALFLAKCEYVRNMPHSHTDVTSLAIELKTVRQYMCLGLGW